MMIQNHITQLVLKLTKIRQNKLFYISQVLLQEVKALYN